MKPLQKEGYNPTCGFFKRLKLARTNGTCRLVITHIISYHSSTLIRRIANNIYIKLITLDKHYQAKVHPCSKLDYHKHYLLSLQ